MRFPQGTRAPDEGTLVHGGKERDRRSDAASHDRMIAVTPVGVTFAAILMRHLLLACLLAAPLAAAEATPVRIVQPAAGARLVGGQTARIAWSGPVPAGQNIEEWEAFLSVDGGQYYSARITPHLDIAIHEFTWTVPNVASRDVRILLRFGNEKDEHAIELPLSLTIDPSAMPARQTLAVAALGESARPGDPGVTQWADGDRSGAHVALKTASLPVFSSRLHVRIAPESAALHSPASVVRRAARDAGTRVDCLRPAQRAATQIASDILLHCCRLNV